MRINSLKIAGFRGFNEERSLIFDSKLTVISAPNSHGKTSVSESLEFLLYGSTSKVDGADAKDEYKDSYRNRHFPRNMPAYIEAEVVISPATVKKLRIELDVDGSVRRYVDGVIVTEWPFQKESENSGRPFVLQHALKNLLLAAPIDRFKGFAQLLGLNEVDEVSRALVGLCTKASSTIPGEAVELLNEFSHIEAKLGLIPNLKKVAVEFAKGKDGVGRAYAEIERYADTFLPLETEPVESRIDRLVKARATMAGKVYSGEISVRGPSVSDSALLTNDRTILTLKKEPGFLDDYARICVAGAEARLQKEAGLLQFGSELIQDSPSVCPLCAQPMDEKVKAGIHERHAIHQANLQKETGRNDSRDKVRRTLREIGSSITNHQSMTIRPVQGLVTAMMSENEARVVELLGGVDSEMSKLVRSTAMTVTALHSRLKVAQIEVEDAIGSCENAIKDGKTELTQAERLIRVLNTYITVADEIMTSIPRLETAMSEPSRIFRQAIDALAGTAEISVLIEVLGKHDQVQRAVIIREAVEGLKVLKKTVEQTLAETMDAVMSKELTDLVMKWYARIKTDGDPNVHFSGFAMDRNKSGDFKSGKLGVRAESYGVPLASAVSSLSESKLNALGLCVNIASAIRQPGPWNFLIIDDPIQSWDDEHEDKFVDVLRCLIEEEGKQIIVLTHKGNWADRVCDGFRSMNGYRYNINGYEKNGPVIAEREWATLENRIKEVKAIVADVSAPPERIQQAEEELRIIACQLAEKIALSKLNQIRSAHKMNSSDVRSILISAGAPTKETDDLYAVCSSADDAHHAPTTYQPSVQRVRVGLSAVNNAKAWML